MKPRSKKLLISIAIVAGLIITQACGSKKSTSTSATTGAGNGNTEGVTVSNEVSSPADMSVGDIIMAQFSSTQSAEFDFSGVAEDSQYYLAVGSLGYGYGSHFVTVGSSISVLGSESPAEVVYSEENWDSWTVEAAFNQRLRDVGLALALDPEMEMAGGNFNAGLAKDAIGPKAAVSLKAVGDTESFRVLNSLTSLSSYTTVTGRVKCVGDNMILYLDTELEATNPDDLTDADIATLCENFDDQVALERSWYGQESDVNGDGKVAALLTPQVNRLGSMGGGIITGFFLASDLYARNGSNAISNEREIIYALVPDSDGDYGLVIPKDFCIDNLLTAVLPHEFQHVISYGQMVFEGPGTPETNWLNEGMSHLAEDLVGFGQENYSRVGVYLNAPSIYSLAASGSPGLGERGASYLFMRFLYEQHPNPADFLWGLYHSDTNGVANIEAAFNGSSASFDQFGEFFMRWMTAVAMTDRGLSQDTRYVYEPRRYNSTTERWQGICLVCDADDGRGTTMSGPNLNAYTAETFNVYSSAARFYDISSVPGTISFATGSTDTFGAVLIRKQ